MTITKSTLVRLNAHLSQFFTWGDRPIAGLVQDRIGNVLDDRFSVSYASFYWVVPARGVDALYGLMDNRPKGVIDIRQINDAFLDLLDKLEAELA